MLSAFASVATHAGALLLVFITMQVTRQTMVTTSIDTRDPERVVWIPNLLDGGGGRSGGDQSITPARRAQSPGRDEISIATTPAQSMESAIDSPIEPLPILAVPMGNGLTPLAGAVSGDQTSLSRGANAGPGGDGPGNDLVDGLRPGSPGVTTPVVVVQVKPQYTAEAMRAKVQGLVTVECVVLPGGTVGDARIIRSLDPIFGLDQEAIAAAKKWRFKPGLLNGKPVPVIVTIELTFTLR